MQKMQKKRNLDLPQNSSMLGKDEMGRIKGGEAKDWEQFRDWLASLLPKRDNNN